MTGEVGRGLNVEVGSVGREAMRGRRRGRKAIVAAVAASIQVFSVEATKSSVIQNSQVTSYI